jgi:DNA-binding GntR family transcriptional regulator
MLDAAAAYHLQFLKEPLLVKTNASVRLERPVKSPKINATPRARVTPRSSDTASKAEDLTAAEPTISSPDMIFREIVQGLYKGSYVPGQRLVEADLTAKWKVSRGTVREALNRLSAEGIVTLSRHRGAAVRVLDRAEIREILDVLELMIGMAARLAARHIDEANNRSRFEEVFEKLLAFRDQPASFDLIRARNRFYRTLAAIGGNRQLQDILGRIHVHLVRVQLQALQDNLVTDRFDDYSRVGQAVLAGEARRAEVAARLNVRNTGAVLDKIAD